MIVKIKLNQNLSTPKGKLKEGEIIEISCNEEGTPLDRFWRSRFADSKIDNCLEIVSDKVAEKAQELEELKGEESSAKTSQPKSKNK